MEERSVGALIKTLRRERGMTQKELAAQLHVTEQAVSRWEREVGCPDVGLLTQICNMFGVSMTRLLQGDLAPAIPEVGNMKRVKFYVCPACGNILTAAGGGELHCCGRRLDPLKPQKADEAHGARVEAVEEDWYITFDHPMEKGHSLSFAALVTSDRLTLVRQWPEWDFQVRLPKRGRGFLYWYCTNHGLFRQIL